MATRIQPTDLLAIKRHLRKEGEEETLLSHTKKFTMMDAYRTTVFRRRNMATIHPGDGDDGGAPNSGGDAGQSQEMAAMTSRAVIKVSVRFRGSSREQAAPASTAGGGRDRTGRATSAEGAEVHQAPTSGDDNH